MPSRPNCEWQTQQIRIAFRFGPRVTHAYFTCDFHTDHLKLSSRKPGICNPSYFEVSVGDLFARMASRCACRHRELTTGAPLPGLPTQSGRYMLDSDVLVEVRGLRPNLRRRRPSLVLSRSPQQLATPETPNMICECPWMKNAPETKNKHSKCKKTKVDISGRPKVDISGPGPF